MKQNNIRKRVLDDALNSNMITQNEYENAQRIEFDMNIEDIPIFINNTRKYNVAVETIKHVTYANIDEYDESYAITLLDNTLIIIARNY